MDERVTASLDVNMNLHERDLLIIEDICSRTQLPGIRPWSVYSCCCVRRASTAHDHRVGNEELAGTSLTTTSSKKSSESTLRPEINSTYTVVARREIQYRRMPLPSVQ